MSILHLKMKTAYILFFLLILVSCVNDAQKQTTESFDLTAKVIYLKDGDSFVVLDSDKNEVEVRMLDIDAPELYQPFGKKSKTYLSKLIKGKMVGLDFEERDQFGRILADVYVDTLFVNAHLIKEGMAWHFTRFSSDETFAQLEDEAHAAQRGLWNSEEAMPPWEWREQQKENR